jgi:exonuclease SbcD
VPTLDAERQQPAIVELRMRFLHTSDWHLGATLGNHSRADDHRLFLDHLLGALVEHKIDVLLVAGDIYDRSQPSNEAQQLYYRFMAQVARLERKVRVVAIAGNHDSPSFIDAPAQVLGALDAHVVGELGRDELRDRCIVHLPDLDAQADPTRGAVVIAVPFVHEYMLGVSPSLIEPGQLQARFADAFGEVYSQLSRLAADRYPGLPQIGMGHLTCGKVETGDYKTAIHQVGTIGGLPSTIFPPEFVYVALGHIHRPYPVVRERNIWYSGTPVPVSFDEGRSTRKMVRFDVEGGAATEVTTIDVPQFRTVATIEGDFAAVKARLAGLRSPGGLPALVSARVTVDEYQPTLDVELSAFLSTLGDGRPNIVELRQSLPSSATSAVESNVGRDLADLDPEEVFSALYMQTRATAPPERVLVAFRELVGAGGAA